MLTTQQAATLKAFILADPVLSTFPMNSDGSYAIADLLNKPAEPAFIVWKTGVSIDEIMRDGMDWAHVDNLSVGKARIWDWLGRLGVINASVSADLARAGYVVVRAAIYVHCKRSATVLEKLFATGAGTDAVPAAMVIEGAINYQTVDAVRGS